MTYNLIGRIVMLWFCVTLIQASAVGQMKEDIRKEIEQIIYYDTEISTKQIPGYLVGLIYADSVFIYDFGYADFEQNKVLSDTSTFELGGLSKVFTAFLIDILVEEKILNYDQSVNSLLDSLDSNLTLSDLTVIDLISHQSGFPKLPYEFGVKEKEPGNPYAHYTKLDLLDFYRTFKADRDAKKRYAYSNVNYALLEIIIERVTGQPYEKVLGEKILKPFALANTYVHNEQSGKVPTAGFSLSGNRTKAFTFQAFAASEGIKSTMGDLLQFVRNYLYEEPVALLDNMNRTLIPIAETKLNKHADVAYGWHIIDLKKYYPAVLHSGSTNGHRAYIGFVKESKTGVVVLSNSENGMDGLGFLVLRMLNHNWKKQKKNNK